MDQVISFFNGLLSPEGFPARWVCGQWTPFHGWLYIVSDVAIWGAYMSIPLVLLSFIWKRRDIPFQKVFWLFALFIFACGTTHLMDAFMFWWPAYRLTGLVYFFTAVVSWMTALALLPIIPRALSLRSPAELEKMVQQRTEALRNSEQAALVYATRLEKSNRELEQFATMASHDLQAPLRKIQVFADRLMSPSDETLPDQTRVDIARIQKAAHRMQQLVNDLLLLSRVTRKIEQYEPVPLSAIVQEVLDDLRLEVESTGAQIHIAPLCTVEADPVQMRQLIQNLIENALKFRKPDVTPVITMTATTQQGVCHLRVEDNGIGFDAAYRDKIFEVFQRLHDEQAYPGTGIGLTICRKIVERHGGSISAFGNPGEGAVFEIQLPLRQQADITHPQTIALNNA